MDRVDRIVIAGGGECGARSAVGLRDAGFSGVITLVSAEPEVGYERPPLSKDGLRATGPTPVWAVSATRLADADIDVRRDVAIAAIDCEQRTLELGDGSTLPFDRALLATGARPRRLDVPGGDRAHVLRTLGDARHLHEALRSGARVVVVGAGLIGLEVAAAARVRGAEVTVVEAAPLALGRAVPPHVAETLVKRHAVEGVTFHFDATVEAIDTAPGGTVVMTSAGEIGCDVVVAGIGVVPNTDLAATAGLAVDNGIAVDARLTTSDPAIFAAGDCCSFPHPLFDGRRMRLESWRSAVDQSEVAVRNLLGAGGDYGGVPWFWSDQYDLGLQVAGVTALATATVVRERPDGSAVSFGLDPAGRLVAACGVAVGTTIARDIRLAEMLIAARAHPDPTQLADASVPLKSLVAAHERSH